MLTFLGWLLLLVLCWPLALLALLLWPIVWLISLPFRLIGITFDAVFAFLRAVLFLPARVLGGGDRGRRQLVSARAQCVAPRPGPVSGGQPVGCASGRLNSTAWISWM